MITRMLPRQSDLQVDTRSADRFEQVQIELVLYLSDCKNYFHLMLRSELDLISSARIVCLSLPKPSYPSASTFLWDKLVRILRRESSYRRPLPSSLSASAQSEELINYQVSRVWRAVAPFTRLLHQNYVLVLQPRP
jgi:hypothetical protein